jgi:hypothetical protein
MVVMALLAMAIIVLSPATKAGSEEWQDRVEHPDRVGFHECKPISVVLPRAPRRARKIMVALHSVTEWTGLRFTRRFTPGQGVLTIKRKKHLSHPEATNVVGLSYHPVGKTSLIEISKGSRGRNLVLLTIHEVGHTLGLVHGGTGVMAPVLTHKTRVTRQDVARFTQVMAYCMKAPRHG